MLAAHEGEHVVDVLASVGPADAEVDAPAQGEHALRESLAAGLDEVISVEQGIVDAGSRQHVGVEPEALSARLKVVQQVREEQLEDVRAIYEKVDVKATLQPFFSDMPDRLAAAHLVIARSGAGTVSEIAAVGRPSILIPLKIAMDNHQEANAEGLVDAGAADMLLEDNLYPNLIGELLAVRLGDANELTVRAAAAKALGNVRAAEDLADLAEQISDRDA